MPSALSPDARQLHPTEGRAEVAEEPGVDPAQPDIERCAGPVRAADVAGPDCRCEAVVAVVGQREGLFFGIERRDVTDRAEDLLAIGTSVGPQTGDDRWLDV